jgi:hypothetical protein
VRKTRAGIGPKLLIAVIVVGVAWLVLQERREQARIDRLAALSPCRLAAQYVEWRLAFEERYPGAEIPESGAGEFLRENEVFEQAVRKAREQSASRVLAALERLTAIDSASWIRERGDLAPFVEVMLAECPDEVEGLVRGPGQ